MILAQTYFSSSAQAHSDSLKYINSKVEDLDAKVTDKSASIQHLNFHVGNISELLSGFIDWIHVNSAKKWET